MESFRIITNVLGVLKTNCYFFGDKGINEIALIDPADEADSIIIECERNGLKPVAILLTHGHFDHILAVEAIRKRYDIPVYAGISEKTILEDAKKNCSKMINLATVIMDIHCLNDGDIIELAGLSVQVISTPGHTAGSVCYYIKSEGVLFSGDTLFKETYGTTSFPTASKSAIVHSIKAVLFELPDTTVVYPGHGDSTTIGHEKQYNMILDNN